MDNTVGQRAALLQALTREIQAFTEERQMAGKFEEIRDVHLEGEILVFTVDVLGEVQRRASIDLSSVPDELLREMAGPLIQRIAAPQGDQG